MPDLKAMIIIAIRRWVGAVYERISAAERGENPTVLARMTTGWAVIGDTQHLPGYCLLLHAGKANHLTDLNGTERAAFLLDMSLLGEAVSIACREYDQKFRRINYEILGNSFEHLHAHVHPRYEWEPPERRRAPVWTYTDRKDARYTLDDRHQPLRTAIARELHRLLNAERTSAMVDRLDASQSAQALRGLQSSSRAGSESDPISSMRASQ